MPQRRMSPQRKLELEFAESIGHTELSLRRRNHEEFRAEMLRFLKRMQARTTSAHARREMDRRVTEVILSRLCMLPEPEPILLREFKRMTRLGFSSIDRRVHIAAMLGRWVQLGKGDSPIVRPFIADTARRVQCLKRGRYKRECMKDIEQAMVRTGMKPA